jgi:prenyltransferase beta subunit
MLELNNVFKPTILGIFIIFVFCINPITNTAINENLNKDSESTPNLNSNLEKGSDYTQLSQRKLVEESQRQVANFENNEKFSLKSSLNEEYLNLSVNDLVTFIQSIYENFEFRDVARGTTSYHTTIAAMQTLSILKMTGLEEYIVPNEITTRTNIIDNLKLISPEGVSCSQITSEDKVCGYSIDKSQNTPSLSGTFGAIMSIKLLGNPGLILGTLSEFIVRWIINENLITNSTHTYFRDSSSNVDEISILDNYWAIASLELLGFNFNNNLSLVQDLVDTFQDLWVIDTGFFHFNDFDDGLSTLVKNYYATSALLSLNRSTSIDLPFWNNVINDLPKWIGEFQIDSGVYQGGFSTPPSISPNVVDTGAALAILSILNNSWSEINLTEAINFLLMNQYTSSSGSNSNFIGGWGLNNETYNSANPKVNTKSTFFAILGLFASDYLANITIASIETSFGRGSGDTTLLNHLIAGETPSSIFVIVHLTDDYSYSNLNLDKVNFTEWNINEDVEDRKLGNTYEYEFILEESASNNWTWGVHKVSAFYELKNFNLLSKSVFEFEAEIVVGPRFSFSFVNISTDEIKPGTEITSEITLDNATLDPDESGIQNFGNFSIEVYYPNGSSYPVTINNTLEIHKNTTTYWFNNTISDIDPLGEYYFNITILNNTDVFMRKTSFFVDDTIVFKSINGLIDSNEKITLYPGSNTDLILDLSYSNNKITSDVEATIYFLNYNTGKQIFSTNLIYQNTTVFKTNTSDKIPKELIMGDYNLTVNFVWKSPINTLSFNSTITNSTLPFVTIAGEVLVSSETFAPGDVVQLGDDINFTTKLLIKTPDAEIQIMDNFELRGTIYYQSEDNLIQTLSYEYLGSGYGVLYGKIRPNLKISSLDEKDYFLKVEYLMNSTSELHTAKDDQNKEFKFEFSLNAALSISNSIFIQGNDTTNKLYTPVIIIDFTVFNQLNNEFVGLLDLNGTITDEEGNVTILSNPIVPIESIDNSSYQIQIPTVNLAPGLYNISIFTINAVDDNHYLGSIMFGIIDEAIEGPEEFPIEIFLIFSLLIIAVATTYLRGKVIKDH